MKKGVLFFTLCVALGSSIVIYAYDPKLTPSRKAVEFFKGTFLSGVTLVNVGAGIGGLFLINLFSTEFYHQIKTRRFLAEDLLLMVGLPCVTATLLWSVPKIGAEARNCFEKAFSRTEEDKKSFLLLE